MSAGHPYTLAAALDWRENWSESDRRYLREQAERLGVAEFSEPANRSYLTAKDATGRSVMYINPGYVEFHKGGEPEGAEIPETGLPFVTLSTFQARDGAAKPLREGTEPCPKAPWILHPVSGECDRCS